MELLEGITTLFALALSIPCFIDVLYIFKHFNSTKFRSHYSYKLLLFNTLIHSLYLVGFLIYPEFKVGFIIVSFLMIPTYVFVALRKINSSYQSTTSKKVSAEVHKLTSAKKRLAARLKREKVRLVAKSKWK